MKYFYYLKTADKEIVYQDEEIIAPVQQKMEIMDRVTGKLDVELTKEEILADSSVQKIAVYDTKTEKKTEVDAGTAETLLVWDGSSPFYQVIKGISPEAIPFLGWPQVSEENYVPPVEEPIPDVVIEEKTL